MDKTKLRRLFYFVFLFAPSALMALFFDEFYRKFVRALFRYFTDDHIYFIGKNFRFFGSPYSALALGIFSCFFYYSFSKKTVGQIAFRLSLAISLFFITTIVFSSINSHLALISCTTCSDGKLGLRYNGIDYDLLFLSSLIIGALPEIISTGRDKWKRPIHVKEVSEKM